MYKVFNSLKYFILAVAVSLLCLIFTTPTMGQEGPFPEAKTIPVSMSGYGIIGELTLTFNSAAEGTWWTGPLFSPTHDAWPDKDRGSNRDPWPPTFTVSGDTISGKWVSKASYPVPPSGDPDWPNPLSDNFTWTWILKASIKEKYIVGSITYITEVWSVYESGHTEYATWTSSVTFPEVLDLKFDNTSIVTQVVPNAKINSDDVVDLVKGKETLITATLLAEKVDPKDTRQVTVEISDVSATPQKHTITLGSLASGGQKVQFILEPLDAGKNELILTVNADKAIDETDYGNNEKKVSYDVRSTYGINLGYVGLENLAEYASLTELNKTYTDSKFFISLVFPISSMRGTGISPKIYTGVPIKPDLSGMAEDQAKIVDIAHLEGHDIGIGIVPADYFTKQAYVVARGWRGVTFSASLGALCTEGHDTAPAHEVGHLYGLRKFQEEYHSDPPNGSKVGGFYIPISGMAMEIKNRFCFMGTAGYHDLPNRWICSSCFKSLFGALGLLGRPAPLPLTVNPSEPQILILSAILWENGRIDMLPWYYLETGTASSSTNGNYMIRILDASGQVISELSQSIDFVVHADPGGILPSDCVPLVVKVPFPANAERVEILRDGLPIVNVSPLSKLLIDAINAIPQGAYVDSKAQGLKPLLNKAEAFEKMLGEGDSKGALEKLQNDIRKHVEKWLRDGYQKTTPLEITKEDLLQLIDNLILRLKTRSL